MIGFSIMMWFCSALLIFVSFSLLKGNYSSVHGKVFETTNDRKGYAKALGKPVLLIGICLLFSGVIAVILPKDYAISIAVIFILFIAVIAGIVQLVEMAVEKFSPSLYSALGIFLPLIAVNCAIMGASLFMQQRINLDPSNTQYIGNVWDAISYSLGSGFGWTLAIVSMGAIREKMEYSDVPKPLQGLGITFITVGLMAMAMMCFSGLKI